MKRGVWFPHWGADSSALRIKPAVVEMNAESFLFSSGGILRGYRDHTSRDVEDHAW